MGVFEDLRSMLLGNPTLVNLVADKVYNEKAPQGTKVPYITFSRISTVKVAAMKKNRPDCTCRFEFNCVGPDADKARVVAKQVNNSLDRKGLGSIVTCFHAGENDFDEENPERFRTVVDFMVHYTE